MFLKIIDGSSSSSLKISESKNHRFQFLNFLKERTINYQYFRNIKEPMVRKLSF